MYCACSFVLRIAHAHVYMCMHSKPTCTCACVERRRCSPMSFMAMWAAVFVVWFTITPPILLLFFTLLRLLMTTMRWGTVPSSFPLLVLLLFRPLHPIIFVPFLLFRPYFLLIFVLFRLPFPLLLFLSPLSLLLFFLLSLLLLSQSPIFFFRQVGEERLGLRWSRWRLR